MYVVIQTQGEAATRAEYVKDYSRIVEADLPRLLCAWEKKPTAIES